MNRLLLSVVLPLISTLFCAAVFASSPQKNVIVGSQLSGLFHEPEADGYQGVYFDILQQALMDTGLEDDVEILVLPMARAKRGFVNKMYACYAPGITSFDLHDEEKDLEDVLISTPLNRAIVRIISKSPESIVNRAEDVPNYSVISVVRGTPMSEEMTAISARSAQTFFVTSETENVQMLLSDKVDYLFAFYPDILFAYDALQIAEMPHSTTYTPLVIDDTLICHPQYQAIFEKINQKLLEYSKDGFIKQKLGKYYMLSDQP